MNQIDRETAAELSRFRAALEAASAHSSDEAVEALRDAAAPIMARLRTEYVADGSPYGDENAALFRWVRGRIAAGGTIARRAGARESSSSGRELPPELSSQRTELGTPRVHAASGDLPSEPFRM
jgi:hypothetical protein